MDDLNLVEKQLFARKAHLTISSRLLLAPGEDWGLVPGRKVEQEEGLDGFSEQGSKLE